MTYRNALHRLGDDTAARVLAIYASFTEGNLDSDETVGLIATTVALGNSRATALADASLAATLMLALREPIPTLGLLPPPGDVQRLHKAAGTLLDVVEDTPDPLARVGRLGHSEPLTRAADAFSEGMAKSVHVTGWRRGLSGSPCQLCRWWWRDGTIWPATHPMPTHKGCSCTPQPTTKENA